MRAQIERVGARIGLILAILCLGCAPALAQPPEAGQPSCAPWPEGWVVSADEVAGRLSEATVLDVAPRRLIGPGTRRARCG